MIGARQAAALATRTAAGGFIESAVLEHASAGDDLLDALRVERLSKTAAVVVQATHERDKDPRPFPHETWASRTTLE